MQIIGIYPPIRGRGHAVRRHQADRIILSADVVIAREYRYRVVLFI